jgi:hypothetical protein
MGAQHHVAAAASQHHSSSHGGGGAHHGGGGGSHHHGGIGGSKKRRDPNAPKAVSNAYMIFCKQRRQELKAASPDLPFGKIGARLGEMWRQMSNEEKKPYEEQAALDRERYRKEMLDYQTGNMPASAEQRRQKQKLMEAQRHAHQAAAQQTQQQQLDSGSDAGVDSTDIGAAVGGSAARRGSDSSHPADDTSGAVRDTTADSLSNEELHKEHTRHQLRMMGMLPDHLQQSPTAQSSTDDATGPKHEQYDDGNDEYKGSTNDLNGNHYGGDEHVSSSLKNEDNLGVGGDEQQQSSTDSTS